MAGSPCFIGHEGQEALYLDRCPFCDADSDETRRFEQEDGRMGGFLYCALIVGEGEIHSLEPGFERLT